MKTLRSYPAITARLIRLPGFSAFVNKEIKTKLIWLLKELKYLSFRIANWHSTRKLLFVIQLDLGLGGEIPIVGESTRLEMDFLHANYDFYL